MPDTKFLGGGGADRLCTASGTCSVVALGDANDALTTSRLSTLVPSPPGTEFPASPTGSTTCGPGQVVPLLGNVGCGGAGFGVVTCVGAVLRSTSSIRLVTLGTPQPEV